jgi:hypothetical protein
VNGLRVEFDTRLAWLPGKTFDGVGDPRSEVSEFDLNRNDGSLTLNMDGFSAAYAKLRKSCDEAARDARAVALRPAPWLKPVAIPSIPGDSKAPWNPPAARGPAFLQNSPAAPIPPATETVQSAPEAVASPTQAEPVQQSCKSQIADAPQHLTGRVTNFISAEQALARTSAVEAELGAKINPAYLSLKRVEVEKFPESSITMAAVPENLDVRIGDVVELNSRYRDPSLPCHFIPWTIGRLVGRAG